MAKARTWPGLKVRSAVSSAGSCSIPVRSSTRMAQLSTGGLGRVDRPRSTFGVAVAPRSSPPGRRAGRRSGCRADDRRHGRTERVRECGALQRAHCRSSGEAGTTSVHGGRLHLVATPSSAGSWVPMTCRARSMRSASAAANRGALEVQAAAASLSDRRRRALWQEHHDTCEASAATRAIWPLPPDGRPVRACSALRVADDLGGHAGPQIDRRHRRDLEPVEVVTRLDAVRRQRVVVVCRDDVDVDGCAGIERGPRRRRELVSVPCRVSRRRTADPAYTRSGTDRARRRSAPRSARTPGGVAGPCRRAMSRSGHTPR